MGQDMLPAPTIVWFRNDLRLHDHEPLALAMQDGGPFIPVYVVDPRDFGETHVGGFPKTGNHRARFLLEALADLREGLRDRGGDLLIRTGRPEDVLAALVVETGARQVRYHDEPASEERVVAQAVERALLPLGASLVGSWGHTLLHPDDLPFRPDELPELFTRFRTGVEGRSPVPVRACFPTPSCVPPLPAGLASGDAPTLGSLGLAAPASDPRQRIRFAGGERAGLARLEAWAFGADELKTYKETRNGMLRADDSSKLSPWLALGCLSPRAVHAAVRRYESERVANASTYWMIFELLWRDYFRFVVRKHGDRIFHAGGLIGATIAWRHDERALDQWRTGQTGYPLVDAAMRELDATGYTSNRARQNVASFLTKNLGIDWRLGAAWFESRLVDYDVTSNWGNWAYAAGVGNDARGFRFFNLDKQAANYDPRGDFARHWLPELAPIPQDRIYRPDQIAAGELERLGIRLGTDYPRPIVDFRESARACERAYEEGTRSSARRPGSSTSIDGARRTMHTRSTQRKPGK